jgi:ribose transport system permease protein
MSVLAPEDLAHVEAATRAQKKQKRASLIRDYTILAILLALIVWLSIQAPNFLTLRNWMNLLANNAPLTLIAFGTTFVMIGGAFDLSTGQIMSFAGLAGAEVAVHAHSAVLGVICGVLAGLPLGGVNGALVAKLRINSFLATLATGLVMGGLAQYMTGGYSIDLSQNRTFVWLGSHSYGQVPVSVMFIAFSFIVLTIILARTRLGRNIYAVGSNREAARLSGIPIVAVRTTTFAIGGLTAALGGMIFVTQTGVGQIVSDPASYTLNAIAAVVIGGTSITGGRGAIWRTAAGLLVLELLQNAFNLLNVQPYWQQVVAGIIIIIAVVGNRQAV